MPKQYCPYALGCAASHWGVAANQEPHAQMAMHFDT